MSGRSSMREGPLSELFRNTSENPPQPPDPVREPPAWGREQSSFPSERSNYLAVIKCVGIGGAGVNAINRMIEAGIRGVEFIAINTDRQSLDATEADVRIPVGLELTRGRGTGGDPALGEQAMRESEEHIRRALRGADLVFIATGEGGGTGTGGAPVVAKLAREMGALTIAVVTRPFAFEGSRRQNVADTGVAALRDQADTIIVIQNDRLMSVLDRGVSMVDAFRVCDDLLRQGVQGITDMITLPGLINLDFADVRTVIRGAGTALLGIGYASGANRAEDAALAAISSPLLETPIDGARGILLGITGGPDLSLAEINRAARVVADASDPEANIIFGATVDPDLEGKVWVTVVAAGFTGRRAVAARPREAEPPISPPRSAPPAVTPAPAAAGPGTPFGVGAPAPAEPPEAPDLSAIGGEEGRTRLFESPYPAAPRRDEPGQQG
jgi:cell division protein FtsZ